MKPSKKKFLKLPEFPGGKEAFKVYIKSNLKYPEQALKEQVEGIVYLTAEIDDNGEVFNVIVENGLGAGCDEEAIRLIKNVCFGSVKNRGVRVKTRKKFRIRFELPPESKIDYQFINKKEKKINQKNTQSYTYTIRIDNIK